MAAPTTMHKVVKRQYNFMIDDDIIEKLHEVAAIEKQKTLFDITVSDIVRKSLIETLKAYGVI